MTRPHLPTALRARIGELETRLAPVPRAEPTPFADWDVVAEVEQGAAKFRAYTERIAERWRTAPETFAPWELRPRLEQLLTAATPEQVEEATQLFQSREEERRAGQSEYVRQREEQYFAEYERQKRRQALRGPGVARLAPSGRKRRHTVA